MNCQQCNSPLEAGAKVCHKCGAAVSGATPVVATLTPQLDKKKKLMSLAVAAVILIVGVAIASSQGKNNKPVNNVSVKSMVETAKSKSTLPKQIDANTSLVDITAQPNAVRYHYAISGISGTQVTNESLKQFLLQTTCTNPEIKAAFDQGVGIEYAYDIKESENDLFVSFSKADCVQ